MPQASSHYVVDFCCTRSILGRSLKVGGYPTNEAPTRYHETPGYHGNLFFDPASGAIVRVTLEADLKDTHLMRRVALSIEYGVIEIGGANYVCPTRSVAIWQDMNRPGKVVGGDVPVTRINETTFAGYHRFGSTSRILPEMPEN